ncbi:MAG: 1-(5-phosphoribosyl)-5-[(5-phosphoribosylamino)methylideneamino]imidazole-4-carboxamide isomerase [Clostridiales bacterium]|nr:1-(5-phosphoribosyl)-5-[(5-phosphoribosylamino)methylideneamino]imidazole-4-carboxamide isomerase [Clostridiales bacterium]
MKIYPAIDVLGGKAVRLLQGDYDKATVFNDNPAAAAEEWVRCNAEDIHIVDLDGARYGKSYVTDIIRDIKSEFNIRIQTGGGVRSLSDIDERIEAGADRVIIGTAAVKNPGLVREAVIKYGERIAVGIDAKNGYAAVSGWREVSGVRAAELALNMKELGIKTVIYTDISKDGMMTGPNIEATREMIEKTGLDIIASGGVSSIKDIENVYKIGAYGVIIGKALYNGSVDLKEVTEKYLR